MRFRECDHQQRTGGFKYPATCASDASWLMRTQNIQDWKVKFPLKDLEGLEVVYPPLKPTGCSCSRMRRLLRGSVRVVAKSRKHNNSPGFASRPPLLGTQRLRSQIMNHLPLNTLPAELRNLIFHFTLSDESTDHLRLSITETEPALTRSCRQIRLETWKSTTAVHVGFTLR